MKRILRLLIPVILACVVMLIAAWSSFYGNAVRKETSIELSSKLLKASSASDIIDSLVLPHIKHHAAFNLYAKRLNLGNNLAVGHYELKKGMSVIDIVRMLKLHLQSPISLTFNNARRVENLAGRIGAQIEADSVEILEAIRSKQMAQSVGVKVEEMIAIFIPNTYEIWWTTTPSELINRMKTEYDNFWTAERDAARKKLGLSRMEVSTLASIVFEESAKDDEMPRIAGVYLNRLRRNMKLQADPTVKFAVGDFTLKRILHKHLTYRSPYNTYLYKGLPPAPIAAPSIVAINAVLHPERHNYLYFCARAEMDGYHNFAATYSEHLRNARAYSAELNKRGIL